MEKFVEDAGADANVEVIHAHPGPALWGPLHVGGAIVWQFREPDGGSCEERLPERRLKLGMGPPTRHSVHLPGGRGARGPQGAAFPPRRQGKVSGRVSRPPRALASASAGAPCNPSQSPSTSVLRTNVLAGLDLPA